MLDSYGREISYMRISVTDRCNLRCRYCMPEGINLIPMEKILTYEEIVMIAEAAVMLGITRFKITGGEPLIRKGVTNLIGMLKSIDGLKEVTLTTNGLLLPQYARELKDAGIDGINVSLDSLNPDTYVKITGSASLDKVIDGIDMCLEYGIKTKINSVVLKDIPTGNYIDLAKLAIDKNVDVRFVEIMPIGSGLGFESLSCNEIIQELRKLYPTMTEDCSYHGNGPAKYYKVPGFKGDIGIINSVHNKFCDSCNRIRLTSTGELKPCLCYGDTFSLMPALRGGLGELTDIIKKAVLNKPCGHDFAVRENISESRSMSQIGG